MIVNIVHDSRTGNTEAAAQQIAGAFRAAGLDDVRTTGLREADAAAVAAADWICIGSWTQGLFVVAQHPTAATLDFIAALPDLSGKSALVFCSYALMLTSDVVDRDEVWVVSPDGAAPPTRVTDRPGAVAFEPTFSPDGAWIAFESHPEGSDGDGSIWRVRTDGTGLVALTDGTGDDRQPNWSPAGDRILFQSSARSGNWDVWTMDPDGGTLANVTASAAEDTDASWSPDGAWIVYSSDEGALALANLWARPSGGGPPVRVTRSAGYDGAPAWSPDGGRIAFEATPADPDGSSGAVLFVVPAP